MRPLVQMNAMRPYPLDAFPGLLGQLTQAQMHCGMIPELAGPIAISLSTLATQDLASVRFGTQSAQPPGQCVLILASSGTGKSMMLHPGLRPFVDFDAEQARLAEERAPLERARERAWAAQCHAVEDAIAKNIDDSVKLVALQERLQALYQEKPKALPQATILCQDMTAQAVVQDLTQWYAIGIVTDEAALLLNERPSKNLPLHVRLNDGTPYIVSRVSTGRKRLEAPRFCSLLMLQPDLFFEHRLKHGKTARASGWDARNLFSVVPPSSQSFYFHTQEYHAMHVKYSDRVKALLNETVRPTRKGANDRRIVELSPAAAAYLQKLNDTIRQARSPGGALFSIADYAARHAERTAKVAAAWHVFEGVEGNISLDYIERAEAVCSWHLDAYLHYFAVPVETSLMLADAQLLESHLQAGARHGGTPIFKLSKLRNESPNVGLTKARFDRALEHLCSQRKTQIIEDRNVQLVRLMFVEHPFFVRQPMHAVNHF